MKFFEKYSKWIAMFVFSVAVIAVYKTFDNLGNVLRGVGTVFSAFTPFVIGFVIAYLLNIPAVKIQSLLEKTKNQYVKKRARGISILIIYLIGLIIVALILGALIPALYKNFMDLYNNLPSYVLTIENTVNNLEIVKKLVGEVNLDLSSMANSLLQSLDINQFGRYAQGVFSVTSGFVKVFIAIVASVYMLIDKKKLTAGIYRLIGIFFKENAASAIKTHAHRINLIFTNYLYSRLICCAVMGAACTIVLSLMRVKYALILGLFIGIMDIIPYFGSIIASVTTVLVTCMTGGLWRAVWTAVAVVVLQQLDGNVLGPKVMSDNLEISPLAIVLAVSVGGTLFGFLGMLLSVPVIAILRAVCMEYIDEKEAKKKLN